MFRKSVVYLLAVSLFLGLGLAPVAEGKELAGIGVKGVMDVLEPLAPAVRDKAKVTYSMKEEKAGPTVAAVGEKKADFGMMTRHLTDDEKKKHPGVQSIQIAKDGVAVIVNKDNPVKALTAAQIRGIFTGEISDWSAVGGKKGKIAVNIREKGAGQRVAFENAIMGGAAVDEKKAIVFDKMGTMRDDVALSSAAIGYILISGVKDVKAIEIDGKAPTVASLKAGTWPIEIPLLLLTHGDPAGPTKTFIDFLLSPEGQKAIERQKVAPVGPTK